MSDSFGVGNFEGLILNGAQQTKLETYILSTLGKSDYELAKDFFNSVWSSSARYKVFLARRCLNLMYTFYRVKYGFPDYELSSTLYSDSSLFASIPEIADSYLKWGGFPEIILVDDILIHGRTINDLIDNLINGVYDYIKKSGASDERNRVESALLDALTIKTMVRTNKPLLLRTQYYQCLKSKLDGSDVWSPKHWRELSLKISQLILENIFYNTSYVLTLHVNAALGINNSLENAVQECGFKKYEYTGRFKRNIWVKPLCRSSGEIVAFYTLRVSQNRIDREYCIVPFVIMANFACDLVRELFNNNKTANSLLSGIVNRDGCERLKAEALYLLLSHNLLLLLQETSGCKLSPNIFDIDKINIVFKSGTPDKEESFPKRVANLTKPFLNWEEMDSLILKATDESQPLFENTNAVGESDCIRVIENLIAEEGREMERAAFLQYSKGIYSQERTGKHPITELFSKLSKQLNIGKDQLSELVGKLLELMDMGSTSVSTKKSSSSGQEFLICEYHPGEQSLFILPRRYAQGLPVLIEMEKDCCSNLNSINKRIEALFKDTQGYMEELKNFVAGLYDSGQRLIDWDINMLLWSEISNETREMYPSKNNDELLTTQMALNFSKQFELIDRYRELYPEN